MIIISSSIFFGHMKDGSSELNKPNFFIFYKYSLQSIFHRHYGVSWDTWRTSREGPVLELDSPTSCWPPMTTWLLWLFWCLESETNNQVIIHLVLLYCSFSFLLNTFLVIQCYNENLILIKNLSKILLFK